MWRSRGPAQLIRCVSEAAGKPIPHEFVERRKGDLQSVYSNPQKVRM